MPNFRTSARRVVARGAVTWVTMVMFVGIAAAAYAAVVFGPAYVLHYEVKQVVRDYGNRAVKNPSDAELVEDMVKKIRSLHHTTGVDDAGRATSLPTVDLSVQDVTWERSAEPPSLHVEFEYPRSIELPGLNRSAELTFRVDLNMDLAKPDWGPGR